MPQKQTRENNLKMTNCFFLCTCPVTLKEVLKKWKHRAAVSSALVWGTLGSLSFHSPVCLWKSQKTGDYCLILHRDMDRGCLQESCQCANRWQPSKFCSLLRFAFSHTELIMLSLLLTKHGCSDLDTAAEYYLTWKTQCRTFLGLNPCSWFWNNSSSLCSFSILN